MLLVGQITLGLLADNARPPELWLYLDAHVQLGLTILSLMLLRLAWRLGHPPPPLPANLPIWQKRISACVHRAIYAILLLMPLSGYALWMWDRRDLHLYGLVPLPVFETAKLAEFWRSIAGYVHEWGFYLLGGLLALHILAALWHELVARDGLVRERML